MEKQQMDKREENDRKEAWNRARYCYGTAEIFKRRQRRLSPWININKFMGFIVPLSVGSAVLTLGFDESLLHKILPIAGIFSFIQLIISLLSLIYNWDSKLESYKNSASKNMDYSEKFRNIGRRYDEDEKYAEQLKEMILLDNVQRKIDEDMKISAKEERFGKKQGEIQFYGNSENNKSKKCNASENHQQ